VALIGITNSVANSLGGISMANSIWNSLLWNNDENVIFCQIEDKTIGNSAEESSMVGKGIGSLLIPGGELKVGNVIDIYIGMLAKSNSENTEFTTKISYGSTIINSSTESLPINLIDVLVEERIKIVVREIGLNGAFSVTGKLLVNKSGVKYLVSIPLIISDPISVDLTASSLLDFTFKWTTASENNSLVVKQLIVFIK